MPKFFYTTINSEGQNVSGTIEAADIKTAASGLRNQKKIITSLKEVTDVVEAARNSVKFSPLDHIRSVSKNDIIIMFRQLSALTNAGVTLVSSLKVLEVQTKKRRLRKIISQVRHDIQEGFPLADALRKHPNAFAPFIVNMIEAGEIGGMLDIVLERIADYLDDQAAFRKQLITGFIYPAIVVVMTVIAVSFLVGFVIPKFMPFISARGGKLPWNTRLLIDITHWFRTYWKHLIISVGAVIGGAFLSYRFKPVKYWIDRIKVNIPVIGPIFSYSVVVRFSRNLSSLIASGVGILQALRAVRGTLGNQAAVEVMNNMEMDVTRGENISTSLQNAFYIFPPIVASMVAVGEETGNMDKTLEIVAGIHDKLLQTYVKRMNSLIEPVLILTMAGIVGFVAWGLIAGVLTMYGTYR